MASTISVTIPVYNEEKTLSHLYERLVSTLEEIDSPFEIIFINDGSQDGSHEKLDQLAGADQRVKVIHFTRNFGQTAAMMAGFDHAAGDIIVPMDGDLQNDPQDIPELLNMLNQGYDLCSGWRNNRQGGFFKRVFVSRIANLLISKISGVKLRDYGCTLKAYRRDIIKGVRLYGEMHRFIPIYASWEGARITEIQVSDHPRRHGKSNYGMERMFKVLLDLIVVTFLDNYAQKPIYLFGGFGFLSFLISFGSFLYAAYLKFIKNISFIQTPLPIIATMTTVTGIMCILMGLLAEMIMRTYYESQQKKVYLIETVRNLQDAD